MSTTQNGQAGRIGRGIRIKGVVRGKEDLTVEGELDGTISLPDHHLILERPSRTTADVKARNTTIRGRHRGNAEATERVEVAAEACVIGDVRAPRLVMREGARFRGTVDMDVPLPPDLEALVATASNGDARVKKQEGKKKKDGKSSD
jgi:cytoskeletal protein CcmA (bactofilin family)